MIRSLLALPRRAWAVLEERLARLAYHAYWATTGFKNYQGNPMPEWSALTETIRRAWCAAARSAFLLGLVFGWAFPTAVCLVAHRPRAAPAPEVRVVERVVTRTVEVEKHVEVKAQQAAKVERVVVYRDRVMTPDGTVREREFEASATAAVEQVQLARAEETRAERIVERRVDARRDWRAGVLLGLHSPLDLRPVAGAHVERRLVGGLYAGAWGLSSGAFGLSASVEF